MKKLIIVIFSFFLISCTSGLMNVSKNYNLDEHGTKGVLAGSVKYSGNLSGYEVHFRKLDGSFQGVIATGVGLTLLPIPPKSDFSFYKGNLKVVDLPAGDYEFYKWKIQSGHANTEGNNFSIKFKINPREITYVGSFLFKQTSSLGFTVTGANVEYTDGSRIDLEKLVEMYPALSESDVNMAIEPGFKIASLGNEGQTNIGFNCSAGRLENYLSYFVLQILSDKSLNMDCVKHN